MVSAVPVPRVANESGTITNSEDAGVRQDRVSRVPPTTPIDRVSLGLSAGVEGRLFGAAVAVATGVVGISVIRVPSVLEGRRGGTATGGVPASGRTRCTAGPLR
ncbi:hypothetical protein GCM10010341_68770 [Streptomyces noursei]|nr:hypothetical protein GCM10010341_68770 [Streptomyces noursei]